MWQFLGSYYTGFEYLMVHNCVGAIKTNVVRASSLVALHRAEVFSIFGFLNNAIAHLVPSDQQALKQ